MGGNPIRRAAGVWHVQAGLIGYESLWEWWEGKTETSERPARANSSSGGTKRRRPRALCPADSKTTIYRGSHARSPRACITNRREHVPDLSRQTQNFSSPAMPRPERTRCAFIMLISIDSTSFVYIVGRENSADISFDPLPVCERQASSIESSRAEILVG